VRDADFLIVLIVIAVVLVWLEHRRTTTLIVLFPKPEPIAPLVTLTEDSVDKVPPRKIGFSYA